MMGRSFTFALSAICVLCLFAGCDEDDGDGGPTQTNPSTASVTATTPEHGSTGVNLNPLIVIRFSEAMNEASLSTISGTDVQVHHVDADSGSTKALIYLAELLEPETTYQITVPTAVVDSEGRALAADHRFSFSTGPLDCAHLTDYFEPNDVWDEFAVIELNTIYPLLTSCGGDERRDYFSFTVADTAKVTLRVTRNGDGPPIYWSTGYYWRPSSISIYSTSDTLRGGQDLTYYYTFLPGEYAARTHAQEENGDLAAYDLILETSAPCPDDEYEDNDTPLDPTPITAGLLEGLVGCKHDYDYYAIEVTAGQTLTMTVTELVPSSVFRGAYLRGPSGIVDRDMGVGGIRTVTATADVDATYLCNIEFQGDAIDYSLEVSLTE